MCPGSTLMRNVCVCALKVIHGALVCRLSDPSHVAVFNQSAQHITCPDLVLLDTLVLTQTRCDRPV